MRFLGGLVIVSAAVALVGYVARAPAEALARTFVARFGLFGFAVGTFLADGLQFPVPPQFYMLLAIASGAPVVATIASIAVASVAAGCLGYVLGHFAARSSRIARATARYRDVLGRVYALHGYWTAIVASLLPVPYSVLCAAAGVNRLPGAFLALVSLCRIPKLIAFYWLVERGWALVTP